MEICIVNITGIKPRYFIPVESERQPELKRKDING